MLDRVLAWAERRDDLAAVVLTGSRARPGGPVDELSDYDLELFTTDPDRYASPAWLGELGRVLVCLPLMTLGHPSLLVFFEGGEKADFQIRPVRHLEALVEDGLDPLYERGYRVLLDRDGLAARLPAASHEPPPPRPPTEEEFLAVVTEFWFEAAHIPRYLRRGELWVVKFRDWTMKELLLRMLEWHAGSAGGDPWHIGTRLEAWAPEGAWERLHGAFGRFDAEDSRRALAVTTALFRDVAGEVAERLGYRYPAELDREVGGYISTFRD